MKRTPKPPVKVRSTVRIDAYGVIDERIHGSVSAAVRRWLKHRDNPRMSEADIESLSEAIHLEVMCSLCDVLRFDP